MQPYLGNSWAAVDYYESSGAGVDHYVDWLGQKGYLRGTAIHLAPHDVANSDWSAAAGRTRREIAASLGLHFERVPRAQNASVVMEQINAVRMLLQRCYFHHADDERGSRVYSGRLSLSLYRQDYNERLGALKASPLHDRHSHAADAFRTFSQLPEGRLRGDQDAGRPVYVNVRAGSRIRSAHGGRGFTLGPRTGS
jgi:hypothetical protein